MEVTEVARGKILQMAVRTEHLPNRKTHPLRQIRQCSEGEGVKSS